MLYKRLAIILGLFALFFVVIVLVLSTFKYNSSVILGGKVFEVKVADTKYSLERGLSGSSPLLDNQGMLFIFGRPDKYGFWMKDMLFPIDIIWIGQDFKITHIEKDLKPESYPKIFYPDTDSVYVLEVSSGQSDLLKIKIGDSVKIISKVL